MIVKCDQCQTRFKIPDDKVTEKGVKVRCTRCSHTFRVARAAEAPSSPPPAAPPPVADPFADFGATASPPSLEATRPGLFQAGIDATRPPEGKPLQPVFSAQQDVPSAVFDQPTRVAAVPQSLLEQRSIAEEAPRPATPVNRPLSDFEPTAPLTPSFPDPFAASAPSEPEPSNLLPDLPPFEEGVPPEESVMVATVTGPYAASAARPSGRPEDVGMVEHDRPGAARRTIGLVLNLGLAAALLVILASLGAVYRNGGKLDGSAFSPDALKSLFAGANDLVAVDVSNGLYDTRSGKQVFYVRGEVANRGDKPSEARVTVEIVDGPLSVSRAHVRVGAAPTPEELYEVRTAEDLAALSANLDAKALSVKPGEHQPFLVVFYEYPPRLADYRLKLTVDAP